MKSLLTAALLFHALSPCLAQLTRSEAVAALQAIDSGVALSEESVVWSPQVDFGFGVPYQGLLPTATRVDPFVTGIEPFPGPGLTVAEPRYLCWIDDDPTAEFMHATRFVLVDAANPGPTVANGGIRVSEQGWWPVVQLPDDRTWAFWPTAEQRTSAFPPGYENPDGLISGRVPAPYGSAVGAQPGPTSGRPGARPEAVPRSDPTACGLIVRGAPDVHMGANVGVFAADLTNHFGLRSDRIVIANHGEPATCDQLTAAIDQLCKLKPPCSSIYVRITSHGGVGTLLLGGKSVGAVELCRKFGPLAAKGVPVHLLINACFSFSLVDTNTFWGFAEGSTLLTSAHANKTSYGGTFSDPGGTNKVASLYADAFSECLKVPAADQNGDGLVDDVEAHDWVLRQQPCYSWNEGGVKLMRYPAGRNGDTLVVNPLPQKRVVTQAPRALGLNVRNGTGQSKTDFHMIFAGSAPGGQATAKRSDAGAHVIAPGAVWGPATISYDTNLNETMVCWADTKNPLPPGQHLLFSYSVTQGSLHFLRAYWTPTSDPPADSDRVPIKTATLGAGADASHPVLRQLVGAGAANPANIPFLAMVGFAIVPTPVAAEDLHFDTAVLLAAATNFIGPISLPAGASTETVLTLPDYPDAPQPALIFVTQAQGPLSQNATFSFEQFLLPRWMPAAPVLTIGIIDGGIVIRWSGAGYLQQTVSPDLGTAWEYAPGQLPNSHQLPLGNEAARFFRIRR